MAKNKITGLTLLTFGLLFFLLSTQIPNPIAFQGDASPKLFPMFSSLGLSVCGIGIALQKDKHISDRPFMSRPEWIRLIKILVALIAYVAGLYFVGYIVSTPFALFIFMKVLSTGKKVPTIRLAAIAVLMTVLLYLAFAKAMSTVLPGGILF
ncbi:MAG: tripartite tricarboxylate transporter TctB family protein [Pygmaiobacter massiliensis]|nr:tripartite tricarboxylate transporter TctB family protein [Pygmaiobacter massiliensis]